MFTAFRADVDPVLGYWHRIEVSCITHLSEVLTVRSSVRHRSKTGLISAVSYLNRE
jgi:hypothetical protein